MKYKHMMILSDLLQFLVEKDIVLVRMHDHDKVKIDEGLLRVVLHGSMCL